MEQNFYLIPFHPRPPVGRLHTHIGWCIGSNTRFYGIFMRISQVIGALQKDQTANTEPMDLHFCIIL
jgi:hypothetical protein